MQIFNICINPQYLCKFSIFVLNVNLQYLLYICVFLSSSLWSVYKQIYLASGVRERDYCSGFVYLCSKSSILYFVRIYIHICVHICIHIVCLNIFFGFWHSKINIYLYIALSGLCTSQIYLASGVRERENYHICLHFCIFVHCLNHLLISLVSV